MLLNAGDDLVGFACGQGFKEGGVANSRVSDIDDALEVIRCVGPDDAKGKALQQEGLEHADESLAPGTGGDVHVEGHISVLIGQHVRVVPRGMDGGQEFAKLGKLL